MAMMLLSQSSTWAIPMSQPQNPMKPKHQTLLRNGKHSGFRKDKTLLRLASGRGLSPKIILWGHTFLRMGRAVRSLNTGASNASQLRPLELAGQVAGAERPPNVAGTRLFKRQAPHPLALPHFKTLKRAQETGPRLCDRWPKVWLCHDSRHLRGHK